MYSDEYYYASQELFDSILGFASLGGLVNLLAFALSVTAYVLLSLGLYSIANRRGIKHAWLAWLPIGNVWILGSISDGYQAAVNGRKRAKRKVLLALDILMCIFMTVMIVCLVMVFMNAFHFVFSSMYEMGVVDEDMLLDDMAFLGNILGPMLAALGVALVVFGLSIALIVVEYMAYYDLFASCDPGKKTLFLVLGIVISLLGLPLTSVFVFACRNKDLGMPLCQEQLSQSPVCPESSQQPEHGADE